MSTTPAPGPAGSGTIDTQLSKGAIGLPAVVMQALTHVASNLRFAVEVFGPDRLMFGSDWPVSTLGGSGGLAAWLEVVTGALGSLSHSEMNRILAGTAHAVYGLTEPSPAWPAGSTQGRV